MLTSRLVPVGQVTEELLPSAPGGPRLAQQPPGPGRSQTLPSCSTCRGSWAAASQKVVFLCTSGSACVAGPKSFVCIFALRPFPFVRGN